MNTVWMEKCAQVGEFLYGIYPYEVLMQLYRLKENDKVLKTELRRFINEHSALMQEYVQKRLPIFEVMGYTEVGYVIPYVPEEGKVLNFFRKAVQDGNAYALLHTDEKEIHALLKDQEDKPFYIPTVAEIEELTSKNWISNRSYEELTQKIRKYKGDEGFPAYMWSELAGGRDFNEIIQLVMQNVNIGGQNGTSASNLTLDELNGLIHIVQECYNTTNLRTNRGWTPKKLMEKCGGLKMPKTIVPVSTMAAKAMKGAEGYLNSIGVKVDYNSGFSKMETIGPHGEVRKIKVGRNDPCPCGSGKKYKKCCGR